MKYNFYSHLNCRQFVERFLPLAPTETNNMHHYQTSLETCFQTVIWIAYWAKMVIMCHRNLNHSPNGSNSALYSSRNWRRKSNGHAYTQQYCKRFWRRRRKTHFKPIEFNANNKTFYIENRLFEIHTIYK